MAFFTMQYHGLDSTGMVVHADFAAGHTRLMCQDSCILVYDTTLGLN